MLLSTFVLILCMVIGTAVAFCNSPIYCEGPILKRIQLARLFPDSKTFVDMVKKKETMVINNNNNYCVISLVFSINMFRCTL